METLLTGLLGSGVAGVVLGWFLIKLQPELDEIRESLDRLTRAQMLFVIAMNPPNREITRQAEELLAEVKNGKAS